MGKGEGKRDGPAPFVVKREKEEPSLKMSSIPIPISVPRAPRAMMGGGGGRVLGFILRSEQLSYSNMLFICCIGTLTHMYVAAHVEFYSLSTLGITMKLCRC